MSSHHAKSWESSWQRNSEIGGIQPERKRRVKVKVHKKRWITTGEKFVYVLFSAIVLSILFYTVSFSYSVDSLNRQVQGLEQDVSAQAETNANLEYEVKELSNPNRILDIARSHGLEIQNTKLKQATKISE